MYNQDVNKLRAALRRRKEIKMDELLYDLFGRSEKEIEFGDLLAEFQSLSVRLSEVEDEFMRTENFDCIALANAIQDEMNQITKKLMNIAFGKDGE